MNPDFEHQNFDLRRKLASFCETVMRCVIQLEGTLAPNQVADTLPETARKLRAAVLAATDPEPCLIDLSGGLPKMETAPALSCTDATTRGFESPASSGKINSSVRAKRLSSALSAQMPCSSGGSSSTEADSMGSTAPSSAMSPRTAAQNSFARRTRLLTASGLVAGITPMSARKTSGQATLDFASSPPAGDGAGSQRAG